jgi:hypothetical protein
MNPVSPRGAADDFSHKKTLNNDNLETLSSPANKNDV